MTAKGYRHLGPTRNCRTPGGRAAAGGAGRVAVDVVPAVFVRVTSGAGRVVGGEQLVGEDRCAHLGSWSCAAARCRRVNPAGVGFRRLWRRCGVAGVLSAVSEGADAGRGVSCRLGFSGAAAGSVSATTATGGAASSQVSAAAGSAGVSSSVPRATTSGRPPQGEFLHHPQVCFHQRVDASRVPGARIGLLFEDEDAFPVQQGNVGGNPRPTPSCRQNPPGPTSRTILLADQVGVAEGRHPPRIRSPPRQSAALPGISASASRVCS